MGRAKVSVLKRTEREREREMACRQLWASRAASYFRISVFNRAFSSGNLLLFTLLDTICFYFRMSLFHFITHDCVALCRVMSCACMVCCGWNVWILIHHHTHGLHTLLLILPCSILNCGSFLIWMENTRLYSCDSVMCNIRYGGGVQP